MKRAGSCDQALTARVRSALMASAGLGLREIHIAIVRRHVRLFGAVLSDAERLRAAAVAGAVAGVAGVVNGLAVRPARTSAP